LTFALTDTKNVVPNTFTAFAFLLAAILQDAFASRTSNLTFFVTAVEYKWNTVSDIRRRSLADVIRGEEVKARLAATRVINWGVNSILAFASALLWSSLQRQTAHLMSQRDKGCILFQSVHLQ